MTGLEEFELDCDRPTYCVTIRQPFADLVFAVIEAAIEWAESDEVDLMLPHRCEGRLLDAIETIRRHGVETTVETDPKHDSQETRK